MTQPSAVVSLLPSDVEAARAIGVPLLPLWKADEHGICCCPKAVACKSAGKHPAGFLVRNGVNDATTDLEILNDQVRRGGNRIQWGGATGHPLNSGGSLAIADLDPRSGSEESILLFPPLPVSPTVHTGSNGSHTWLRTKEPIQSRKIADGIDLKAVGGFVVLAPGRNANGTYFWEANYHISDTPIADAPDWVISDSAAPTARPEWSGGSARNSLLGEAFFQAGLLGAELPRGVVCVKCPWYGEHSDARGKGEDSSSAILPPTADSSFGGFRCQHEHCRHRTWSDVLAVLPPEAVRAARMKFGPRPAVEAPPPVTGPPPHSAVVPVAVEVDAPAAPKEIQTITGGLPLEELNKVREFLHFTPDKKGVFKIKSDVVNAVAILKHDPRWTGIVRFNAFTGEIILTREPPWFDDDRPTADARVYPSSWSDADAIRLALWYQRYWDMRMSTEKVLESICVYAEANAFHPVREYLAGLAWDGVSRLSTWLSTYMGAEDNAYAGAVGKWWMVAAIARVMQPGCKMDNCLIFEGKQGVGKSTALKVLASEPWFCDSSFDLGNKDAFLSIRGKWIVELAELDALSRSDASRAKAFFTSATDRYRAPYGRATQDIPRQCIFAGTVNHSEYLRDDTGNRRYWPVKCGDRVDLEGLRRDRDQLWAEAYALYKSGQKWHPASAEEQQLCEIEQSAREVVDEWDQVVYDWLTSNTADEIFMSRGHVTTGDVLKFAMNTDAGKWTHSDLIRAGRSLSRMPILSKVRDKSPDGRRIWVYKRKKAAPGEGSGR